MIQMNIQILTRIDNTKIALNTFEKALEKVEANLEMNEVEKQACVDAYESMIEDLNEQLQELEEMLK